MQILVVVVGAMACGGDRSYPCQIEGEWIAVHEAGALGFSGEDVLAVIAERRRIQVDWDHTEEDDDAEYQIDWEISGRRARDATLTAPPPPTIGPEGTQCREGRALILPLEIHITGDELSASGEVEAWASGLSPGEITLPMGCCALEGAVSGVLGTELDAASASVHIFGDYEEGQLQAYPVPAESLNEFAFGAYTFANP